MEYLHQAHLFRDGPLGAQVKSYVRPPAHIYRDQLHHLTILISTWFGFDITCL